MRDEDLGILARMARALFPDTPIEPLETIEMVPQFYSGGWRQHEGIWLNENGRFVAGRQRVQIPGLHASPEAIRAAYRGRVPSDPTTRDILADPGVSAAMPEGWVMLREDMVICESASRAAVMPLVEAIDRARRSPWEAVARRHNLPLDGRALAIVGRTGDLRGIREDVDVRIREERRHTRIRVALRPGLPEGFSVRSGSPPEADKLHHPILDRSLHIRGLTGPLRRQLLSVEEPVLNLIADRGESDIDHRRIRVVVPGRVLSELHSLVEDALAVARALAIP